jgi:hypothetical protein
MKKGYEGKDININKLYMLKQAILKNNHERVNF